MKSIKIWNDSPSDKQAQQIADRLLDGEIWILPTDSIYGIMCDALNQKAIRRVCGIKNINPEKTISPSSAATYRWHPNMRGSATAHTH